MITVVTGTGSLSLKSTHDLQVSLMNKDLDYNLETGVIKSKNSKEASRIVEWLRKHGYPDAAIEPENS